MSRFFLGVDGGQSSTTALIGDASGRVVGHGRSGPCNHVKTGDGREKFITAIAGCVNEACRSAGLTDTRFAASCFGFSGGPADKESLLDEIVSTDKKLVTHDAFIALAGATSGEPGVVVIAGTGSMAFGRNGEGRTARAGGWGYIYGDEGGGFDLTRQAVRAALRYEEGWGASTLLHRRLLEGTGAKDANDLLHRFYTTDFPRPAIAAFSKLVDEAAQDGDAIARDILLRAAQELAGFTSMVRGQLFSPGQTARISYIGGVFRSELLLERYRMLMELEDNNRFAAPDFGPAAGALIEAYRTVGLYPALSNLPSEK